MKLFIDTEFIEAASGLIFLSLGIVTDAGHRLYAERTYFETEAMVGRHGNEFVRAHVLPQFNRMEGLPWEELPARLLAWLDQLEADELEVIYDYSGDYTLIEQLLAQMERQPRVRLVPSNVSYLLDDLDGKIAASSCWAALSSAMGIDQHHAFADAVALRARFESVHRVTVDVEPQVIDVVVTVTVVIPMFEVVHADTSDGALTVSIGEGVEGVNWRTLTVGQQLRCRVETGHATRTLSAEVISPTDPQAEPHDAAR